MSESNGKAPLALLVCGALTREVREIASARGWNADLHASPALNHLSPKKLAADVDRKLADLTQRYERVVVVYGDCGTGGALDQILGRHGAVRPVGPHCYEMFGGQAAVTAHVERPGTYFLTDWLVRNWDRAAEEGLGLDRFPWMKDVYFADVTNLLYLRQHPEPALEAKARDIAGFLGLPLEIRDTGLGDLERRLIDVVERELGE